MDGPHPLFERSMRFRSPVPGYIPDPSVVRRGQANPKFVVLWLEGEYVLVERYDPLVDLYPNVTPSISIGRAKRVRRALLAANKSPDELGDALIQILSTHAG